MLSEVFFLLDIPTLLIFCLHKQCIAVLFEMKTSRELFQYGMRNVLYRRWRRCQLFSMGFFKPRYSRGTITLFSNDIEYKLSKVKIDRCGNYIISKIFFAKTYCITLVNLYGPNKDNPDFFLQKYPVLLKNMRVSSLLCVVIGIQYRILGWIATIILKKIMFRANPKLKL